MNTDEIFPVEIVDISLLAFHPRNYVVHPQDEIDHIINSIKQHGIYKNVVVARDYTILAGEGVCRAVMQMGLPTIPVKRLDIDPLSPQALKILSGDNEISHLREINDRQLTEILKEIKDFDADGLLGTGYDEKMLAALVYVTRPESEIETFDEAAEWVGMPDYEPAPKGFKIVVNFRDEHSRRMFGQLVNVKLTDKTKSIWFPPEEKDDVTAVRFEKKG